MTDISTLMHNCETSNSSLCSFTQELAKQFTITVNLPLHVGVDIFCYAEADQASPEQSFASKDISVHMNILFSTLRLASSPRPLSSACEGV